MAHVTSVRKAYTAPVSWESRMQKSTGYLTGRVIIGAAGAETTSAVLAWWMLAMITYLEVQKRAQAVVGRARTPTFEDFQHLPYIRAMVSVAMAARGPCWPPTKATGMMAFLPKGTIMITNVGTSTATLNSTVQTLRTSTRQDFWTPMEVSPRAHLKQKRKATSRTVSGGVSVRESTSRTVRSSSTLP